MNGCGRIATQRRKWCFDHLLQQFLRRASHVTDDARALLRAHQSKSCSNNPTLPSRLLQCQLEPLRQFDYLRRILRDWRKVLEQLTLLCRRRCCSKTAPQGGGLHTPGGFLATPRSLLPFSRSWVGTVAPYGKQYTDSRVPKISWCFCHSPWYSLVELELST